MKEAVTNRNWSLLFLSGFGVVGIGSGAFRLAHDWFEGKTSHLPQILFIFSGFSLSMADLLYFDSEIVISYSMAIMVIGGILVFMRWADRDPVNIRQ